MRLILIVLLVMSSCVVEMLNSQIALPKYKNLRVGPIRVKCRLHKPITYPSNPKPTYEYSADSHVDGPSSYARGSRAGKKGERQDLESGSLPEHKEGTGPYLKYAYKSGHSDGYIDGYMDGRKRDLKRTRARQPRDSINIDNDGRGTAPIRLPAEDLRSEDQDVIAEIYQEALQQALELVRSEMQLEGPRRPSSRQRNQRLPNNYGQDVEVEYGPSIEDDFRPQSSSKGRRVRPNGHGNFPHYAYASDGVRYYLNVKPTIEVRENVKIS